LILSKGAGDPTWSRATKAWGFNELGYLEELASGCAFFGGARLVRNTVRTKSEDFSNAAWIKTDCTVTGANTIVCANATSIQGVNQNHLSPPTITAGQTYSYNIRARYVPGGAEFIQILSGSVSFGIDFINVSLVDGSYAATGGISSSVSEVVPGTYDIRLKALADATGAGDYFAVIFANSLAHSRYAAFVGDGIKSFELLRAWSVDVTNYDASYVPEYVSVGVEASPYFGAGIDGAKYFETDWQGAPIAAANLLRVRREASAINNLLWSRDLRYISLNKWYATTQNAGDSEKIVNGTFPTDTSSWTAASATLSVVGGRMRITSTGAAIGLAFQDVNLVVGKCYNIVADGWAGTGTYKINIGPTAGSGAIFQSSAAGVASDTKMIGSFIATQVSVVIACLQMTPTLGAYVEFDNISIKESAVQLTTATGLDGIANTATTLTATAADAVILQPISLVSAARCASAYVKRRTGTGTISFTQDGGSTWTDITSLINSSTWSRVQITATLANPSVGFKISTSGDAIDVDCVQNEAGAEATSPIVTTTTTVSRNGDSLTYQTTGNIDFAVGTVYSELLVSSASIARRAVYVGSVAASYVDGSSTVWKAYDGTNTVTKSGLSDASTAKRKRVVTWGTGMSVTGDGLTPASGSFDGSFGAATTIDIGNTINGYIGPVAIYNYQMTDAELQAITA